MIKIKPSRNLAARSRTGWFSARLISSALLVMRVTQAADIPAANTPSAIPWNQIGAKAGANYKGDGLAVTPTESGASLHCVFQRLDGDTTSEGLWLSSTVTNTVSDRFRVMAMEVGRTATNATFNSPSPEFSSTLPVAGEVSVCGQTVRLSRPGLTEEYSVSMDGVRQDFIVEQRPPSPPGGELVVRLAVSGAEVEAAADGARLALDRSGRKIAYSRLRVTDATGKELPARIEVAPVGDEVTGFNFWVETDKDIEEQSLLAPTPSRTELAVVVNDANAVYPVRIDPTFSDANWVSMGGVPGSDGPVNAAVVDGSGNLYITGNFTIVDNLFANGIAKWNGSSWSTLGSGMKYGVNALAVSGSTLYAAGGFQFTNAGGIAVNSIAQWNGSSWSALGSGLTGNSSSVLALAVSGSTLFAGGTFTTAGGRAANGIAQWNGASWSPLSSGMNGSVNALAVSGGTLFAGGGFSTADGNAVNHIAQWNGSDWSALGLGIGGTNYAYVFALAVSGGTLYAGGNFTNAGDTSANYIAQWNGSSWSALGSGLGGNEYGSPVSALAVSGGTLYVGGNFTNAGGISANNIAQWNGTSWSALDSGLGAGEFGTSVSALAVSGSTLYAGGYFYSAGDDIAQWNGRNWSTFGSGISGDVSALAVSGSTVFVGGAFTTAGGGTVDNIAQWNGSGWSAVGSGISGGGYDGNGPYVDALAVSGGMLYAGGDFSTAGGNAATNIAQWNGSSWSSLGSGISGEGSGGYSFVAALAMSGSTLYAGGDFTIAGGSPANYIAGWNGGSWSTLGSGMNGGVYALAVSGSTLYAGGYSVAGNNIAQWNGSSWSALGSGMSGPGSDGGGPYVNALAVLGGTLYAGGDFTAAGGSPANYIAGWNGSSWYAIGSGMNTTVNALAVSGSALYAGGDFTAADGSPANYIAQWNGTIWSALGSGLGVGEFSASVSALAMSGNTLYAGGGFTRAGTNVSAYVALANLAGTPVSITIITTNTAFGFTNGVFGFDVSGPSGSNVVIQASTDLQTWIPLQTNLLGSGPLHFSDAQSPANVQRFYRAKLSP